jgi:hypothetical protein
MCSSGDLAKLVAVGLSFYFSSGLSGEGGVLISSFVAIGGCSERSIIYSYEGCND